MEVWTIEVADGPRWNAASWRRAYGEGLVEAAVTHGAREWSWVVRDWGTLVEFVFADDESWLRFRRAPGVQAALDAAPDPENGLWVYNGPGGSSPVRVPRGPAPLRQSGAAPTPEPEPGPELWQQPVGMRAGLFQEQEPTVRAR
ncbi:hypothetical protein [Nakamurella lactea]|uniref:hypothetical protein n=1 Tax=Nakamurella lactea TaxID=459515 RepID=UPI0004049DC8|nr:hypothetical protein [Nakamurella lactea]